ncbi:hypothetical protein [Photobacterium damselae]|uniref:hypothetical protein n=1 Tax=Photobacterium damselae TaxID=38293 RepID=UPI001F359B6C|nr:hypothetical protein [Photobacterium damselae]UKA04973.1 hypothetical protein IHC89_22265 [Photobacterium damselae subsp. damselae]
MRSEFEAKIAVGLSDSVAVMMLKEHQITFDGNKVINGCDFAVKNDMEADSPLDWFHHLRPKGTAEDIGIYHVKGRVKFDEDSADYYNVKVTQIL